MKHNIEGISRIGFIDDYENYIKIDDEVCVPHFYIRNQSKNNSRYITVCIEKPEYCFYNSKENKLNTETKIKLQDFMQ